VAAAKYVDICKSKVACSFAELEVGPGEKIKIDVLLFNAL
jgi:hypothetical protein